MATLTWTYKATGGSANWSGFTQTPTSPATETLNAGIPQTTLPTSNKNTVAASNKFTITGTWASLFGLPTNAVVTGVTSASAQSKCTVFTTGGTTHTADASTLVDGGTTITLSASRSFTAVEASFQTSTGTNATGLSLPTSDTITVTIANSLSNGNSNSATMAVQQDNLVFTITYVETAFNQTDWQNPSSTVPQPRIVQILTQPLGAPRNLNLLVGKDQLPFRQSEWPVTPGRPYDRAISAQQNGTPVEQQPIRLPNNQTDYPNPTLRLSHMAALIAQELGAQRVLNVLIGQDRFYGAPGEVIAYDWPVPAGPPSRFAVITTTQPLGTFPPLFAPTPSNAVPRAPLITRIPALLPQDSTQPIGSPITLLAVPVTAAPFSQDDWANPRGQVHSQQSQPLGSPRNLNLLVGQDVLPRNQKDWQNPLLPISRTAAINAQPLGAPRNLNLLVGKDVLPNNQDDWPNPVLSVSRTAAIEAQVNGAPRNLNLLVGADVLPRVQRDWQNPRGAIQPVQTQPQGSPLNLTLLVGKDVLPLNQDDWTNPVLPVSRIAAITSQPLGAPRNLNLLVGQDAEPEDQRDWENPVLPISRGAALTAQPLGSPTNLTVLVGQDQLPFRQTDWPNPRGAISAAQIQPLGSPVEEKQQIVPAISQMDWPNPVLAISRTVAIEAQLNGAPRQLNLLIGQDALPFRQPDWPNPRGAIPPVQTQLLGVSFEELSPLAPFAQHDWSNPVQPVSRTVAIEAQLLGAPRILNLLVGQDALPRVQRDWPNPVLPISRVGAIEAQLNGAPRVLNLLAGKDALPIRQLDWPDPRGPLQPIQTQPLGAPLNLNLLVGKDVLPFNQRDWPNPRGPVAPIQTQPLGVPVPEISSQAPFAQRDWLNPLEATPPVQTQLLGAPRVLNLLVGKDALPIRQTDWPNPILALSRAAAIEAQLLGTPRAIPIPLGPKPFAQTDWPNPRGPRQPLQTQPLGLPFSSLFLFRCEIVVFGALNADVPVAAQFFIGDVPVIGLLTLRDTALTACLGLDLQVTESLGLDLQVTAGFSVGDTPVIGLLNVADVTVDAVMCC